MNDIKIKPRKKTRYINPYLGGVLLGLVLIAANFVSGRGLGASGAAKSAVVATVNTVAPAHAENADFFSRNTMNHIPNGPMKAWLVFQMLGVIVGAFLSGAIFNRLKFKVEHSPKITSKAKNHFRLIWEESSLDSVHNWAGDVPAALLSAAWECFPWEDLSPWHLFLELPLHWPGSSEKTGFNIIKL